MTHSGVCLPRQYATFADVAYGHRINRFFERLVSCGFASVCPCLHNRALVYHVHHRPLYAAIGRAESRLRRPVPAASVMPRLMLLDAVLEAPQVAWFGGEHEKVEHFTIGCGIPRVSLPQHASRAGGASSSRLFPDALPIGVEAPNRAVFVYPVTRSSVRGLSTISPAPPRPLVSDSRVDHPTRLRAGREARGGSLAGGRRARSGPASRPRRPCRPARRMARTRPPIRPPLSPGCCFRLVSGRG